MVRLNARESYNCHRFARIFFSEFLHTYWERDKYIPKLNTYFTQEEAFFYIFVQKNALYFLFSALHFPKTALLRENQNWEIS